MLPIHEQFVSIQGEGILVGTPSSFVRVAGCNLRCVWCDSPGTSWTPRGQQTSVDEVFEFCARGPRHVVLTGGEPLLFPALGVLSQRLRLAGHHVTVETAGTVWLDELDCDLISVSPKLAHSTPWRRAPQLAHRHDRLRLTLEPLRELLATFYWQLKFVVACDDPRALARDVGEVEILLSQLAVAQSDRDRVLLMPEGVDPQQLPAQYRALASVCAERGFRIGERLHITMFGHTPGT